MTLQRTAILVFGAVEVHPAESGGNLKKWKGIYLWGCIKWCILFAHDLLLKAIDFTVQVTVNRNETKASLDRESSESLF